MNCKATPTAMHHGRTHEVHHSSAQSLTLGEPLLHLGQQVLLALEHIVNLLLQVPLIIAAGACNL